MRNKIHYLPLCLVLLLIVISNTACCECCEDGNSSNNTSNSPNVPDDTDYTYEDCENEISSTIEQAEQSFSIPNLLTLSITSDKSSFSNVGEIINYTYEITDSSNSPQTLENLQLQDDKVTVSCPQTSIFHETVICSGSYTATVDDLSAGFIENHATVTTQNSLSWTCDYKEESEIKELSETKTFTNTASASFKINSNAEPALSLSKTADPSFYSSYQDVNYTFTLTNNGSVSLSSPFSIIDDLIDSWYCEETSSLDPGETMYCYGSYLIDAGLRWTITNTATACGYFGDIQICSNSASASVFFQQPEIPDEPTSGHCGDGIVQFDLGEECDPPEPGLCSAECKYE